MKPKKNMVILRKKNNLTQVQAAKNIGISYSMLAMMEAGHRVGTYETLKKVANYYGVTVDELLDENFFENESRTKRESYTA